MAVAIEGTKPIDAETRVIMNGVPFLAPDEQRGAEAYAKDRIQAFIAGASRTSQYVNEFVRRESGDPMLQIRWDFELDTWILERWQPEGYWLMVVTLLNTAHRAPNLTDMYLRKLVGVLKEHDLQRHDPNEYLRNKRKAADLTKAENRTRGDNFLMAAIDSMSSRQIQNFIDVHKAIHTGETIVAHGADEKSIETMAAASAQHAHEVPVNKALNQGMHPLMYEREPR